MSNILWIAVLLCPVIYFILKRKRLNNIPGPIRLPILGFAPFMGNDPHLTLYKLAEKYGSIYGLYLGNTYVVVTTDVNMAKELYNKSSVSDRRTEKCSFLPDGVGFGFLNGKEWIEQRRYAITEMKQLGLNGSSLEKLAQPEVENFLNELERLNGEPTVVQKTVMPSIANIIFSLITGDRALGHLGQQILSKGIESFIMIQNQSRISKYIAKHFRHAVNLNFLKIGRMIKDLEKMNEFVRLTIGKVKGNGTNNFINNYFKEMEKKRSVDINTSFSEMHAIGNMQALLIGGIHNVEITLAWLFYAMAAFPIIQKKVQEELDTFHSEKSVPCWHDRRILPYSEATVLEGLRWRTMVPLVSHIASDDTKILGYTIPKQTHVIALLWAFHNDTSYWKDPENFQPERFLTEDGKVISKMESFKPFSVGKRRCPGDEVALIEIFLYFTAVMKRFRILPAVKDKPLDLKGVPGISLQPKEQLLQFIPRKQMNHRNHNS